MTTQYLRKMSLIVADASGDGLELSEFRVVFRTTQADTQSPGTLNARVYNVKPETIKAIEQRFGPVLIDGITHVQGRVRLQAGYQEVNYGTIFDGQIFFFRSGRENATDTYIDILGIDGAEAYGYSIINGALEVATGAAMVGAVQDSMAENGVTGGYQTPLDGNQLPRGVTMFGMSRDVMREIAADHQISWSIVDGQLVTIARSSYLPGEAVVLTSKTGLLGLPQQQPDGIHVSALLNSNLRVNGRIQVNNASIQRFVISAAYSAINYVPAISLDADGVYRILLVEHHGDSRGQDWASDMICITLDDTVPPALAARGIA